MLFVDKLPILYEFVDCVNVVPEGVEFPPCALYVSEIFLVYVAYNVVLLEIVIFPPEVVELEDVADVPVVQPLTVQPVYVLIVSVVNVADVVLL